MLYSRIISLRKLEQNSEERQLLEGMYLFNGALEYLANNQDEKSNPKENKVAQIKSMEKSLDNLISDFESKRTNKRVERIESKTKSANIQSYIVDYIISNNYDNSAFIKVARAAESLIKSGAVERARTANKKEDDKLCSEHYVLSIKYSNIGK